MVDWQKFWDRSSQAEDLVQADGYTEQGRLLSRGQIESVQDDIQRKLALKPADSLLEVGCGAGLQLKYAARITLDLAAADYAFGMISAARRNVTELKCAFVAEAGALPLADNMFDKVLCYSACHYFPDYSYAELAVAEMIRVCKPGGTVLIGDIPDLDRKEQYLDYLAEYTRNLALLPRIGLALSRCKNFILGRKKVRQVNELLYSRNFFPDFIQANFSSVTIQIEEQAGVMRILAQRKLRYDVIIHKGS